MEPIYSAAIVLAFIAVGELVSIWSKARVPSLLVAMLGIFIFAQLGLVPKTVVDDSMMPAIYTILVAPILFHMGSLIPLPTLLKQWRSVIIALSGMLVAVLLHDPVLDLELVDAACAAVGLALENERLTAELRAKVRQLAESRAKVLRAAEDERRRLERDLHDGVQQQLITQLLGLRLVRGLILSDPGRAVELVDEMRQAHGLEGLRQRRVRVGALDARIGDGAAQGADRDVGPLRQQHHAGPVRDSDVAAPERPDAGDGAEQGARLDRVRHRDRPGQRVRWWRRRLAILVRAAGHGNAAPADHAAVHPTTADRAATNDLGGVGGRGAG